MALFSTFLTLFVYFIPLLTFNRHFKINFHFF
nr:MAG TPA: hypothetical protein [Caudoviricetes sp.]